MICKVVYHSEEYICVNFGGQDVFANSLGQDDVDDWIQQNSLGTLNWELGQEAHLVTFGGGSYSINSTQVDWKHNPPKDGQSSTYRRRVEVRTNSSVYSLPNPLEDLLEGKGFKKE